MWDSFLIALASLMPFVDADNLGDGGRRAALDRLLDQAVMLHRSEPRQVQTDYVYADPRTEPDHMMNLELAELELEGGFLADTCVQDPGQVRGMRYMIAYVDVMRMLGQSDEDIARDLVEYAAEDGERVRQLVDYIGLENIGRMICLDYMRECLAKGMDESVLREYIAQIPAGPPATAGSYSAASDAQAPVEASPSALKPSKS